MEFGRKLQAYWRPTTGSGNNYLDRIDYGYDYAGNRTYRNVRVDTISGASLDERDQAYSYDGLDRVTDTDQGTANDTTGAITTKKFEQQWKLDQLGNWEEFDQDDNGNGTWDLEQSRTHNVANELTAVSLQSGGAGANWADPAFDAAGNMTTIPQPASLTSSYTGKFDAWNRLVSLDSGSTASYEYDGLNRRIKRTEGATTRHFYYNESWQALEERATEAGTAVKQFVWGAGYVDELVLRDRDADSNSGNGLEERLYAIQDALYNVTGLVSTAGSVQERFAYTPYGASTVLNADMTVNGSGTSYAWEHRYTGRRLDPGSGLQLNRNRYYHQQLGRWCSRDPIGYEGSRWNVYALLSGKVFRETDPTGLKGTEKECADIARKIENIKKDIVKRTEQLVKNLMNLPVTHPDDYLKPSLSIRGHKRIIGELEENLKRRKEFFDKECRDPPPGDPCPETEPVPVTDPTTPVIIPEPLGYGVPPVVITTPAPSPAPSPTPTLFIIILDFHHLLLDWDSPIMGGFSPDA